MNRVRGKRGKKSISIFLVFSLVFSLFSSLFPISKAEAAISQPTYGLTGYKWNSSTNNFDHGDQVVVRNGKGPDGEYWFGLQNIYINGSYAGQAMGLVYGKLNKDNGYPYVDIDYAQQWVSAMNGDPTYVSQNWETATMILPGGGTKTIVLLSSINILSGGRGDGYDSPTQKIWYKASQDPETNIAFENNKVTYKVGETGKFRVWGKTYTNYNKSLNFSWSGNGQSGNFDVAADLSHPKDDPFQYTSEYMDITFTQAGTFTFTVRTRDSAWRVVTKQINVAVGEDAPPPPPDDPPPDDPPPPPPPSNEPPRARFDMPSTGFKGEKIRVRDRSSDSDGTIVSWDWDVNPSSGVSGSLDDSGGELTFSEYGTYTVYLEVEDDGGETDDTSKTIEIKNLPPDADFSMSDKVIQGEDVTIENKSDDPDGEIVDNSWTIQPDQGIMNGPLTDEGGTIYFDIPGTYTVTLNVEDDAGMTDSVSKTVEVEPAIPTAILSFGDYYKQNRLFVADGSESYTSPVYPMTDYEFEFVPLTAGVTASDIKISAADSTDQIKKLLFKKPGNYKVRLRVRNTAGHWSEWTEMVANISPDENPVIDFYLVKKATRDASNGKKAKLEIVDESYSPDQDIITKRTWKYRYDTDNDGSFTDESWITFSNGNDPQPALYVPYVGTYQIHLYAEESFGQPTIPALITAADKRVGDTTTKPLADSSVEVINIRPVTNFVTIPKKKVDIIFTVGDSPESKTKDLKTKIVQHLETRLNALNVDYGMIQSVESTQFSMQDTFDWQAYDHGNHINIIGKDIQFWGYKKPGYKDFLFLPNTSPAKKTFEFTVDEAVTDWHTLEGAGYLFNAKIENGILSGYAILLANSSVQLYEISGVNALNFHNASYSYMSQAGTLIGTYTKLGSRIHNIKIEVTPDKIEMWDNGTKIINSKALTKKYGNGFGPMASYLPHNCSSISRINFANIKMETSTGRTLDEILKEPTWRDDALRFVVSISDKEFTEFNDPEKASIIYSRLLQDNINFSVMGTSVNQAQAQKIFTINDNKGKFVYNTNMDTAMQQMADYIISQIDLKQGDPLKYVLLGQEVQYETSYIDRETDPEMDRRWMYTHNPNYYQNSLGLASFHNQFIPDPIIRFDKTGKYEVVFQAKDNPKNDIRFDQYRLWSDIPIDKLQLFVHRKPLANYTYTITPIESGGTTRYERTNIDFSGEGGCCAYWNPEFSAPAGATLTKIDFRTAVANDDRYYYGYVYGYKNGTWETIKSYGSQTGGTAVSDVIDVTGKGYIKVRFDFQMKDKSDSARGDGTGSYIRIDYSTKVLTGYKVSFTDTSYDLDHQSKANKGIVAKDWRWKEVTENNWRTGLPTTLATGKFYLIYLRVQDEEGAWSDANVKVISTASGNIPPVAQFTVAPNPLPLSQTLSYDASGSYDPDPGDSIIQYNWRVQRPDGAWIDYGTNPPKTFSVLGDYRIELTVKDNNNAWSEPYYQIVEVIANNLPPIAQFSISPNPLPLDVSATYKDTSYDPDGDPIVAWEWKYRKNSGAWLTGNPTNFSALGTGTYQIALRVKDQPPIPQLTPLWSSASNNPADWFVYTLTVVEGNKKPIANLVLSPNPVPADEPLSWVDRSTDPEGKNLQAYELKITQIETGATRTYTGAYTKASGASLNMSSKFIQIFETSGFQNDGVGSYRIEYRVQDTSPNGASPTLWSDWQVQTLIVEDPLYIEGDVNPKTARSGQAITLSAYTEGKAERVEVKIDWNQDGDFNDESETVDLNNAFPITSKTNDWSLDVIIPLPTKDGDYILTYTVYKTSPWDGSVKTAKDSKTIRVQGDIHDDYKVEIYE